MDHLLITLAALSILGAVTAILCYRHNTRRTMQVMSTMLDEAIAGRFLESHFDESLLSSLEMKLARYLGSSRVSAQNLAKEKDTIKELISDISHQTKTPVANILLYSQLLGEQDLLPAMPLSSTANGSPKPSQTFWTMPSNTRQGADPSTSRFTLMNSSAALPSPIPA